MSIPFGRNVFELVLVFGINLRSQRRRQHELPYSASKSVQSLLRIWLPEAETNHVPSQERIKREIGDENTIEELNNPRHHYEQQESVNEFETVWCF
jgi:hypothetical protein